MNENLNLVEVLKDCPEGTKLYSTIFGEVEFGGISQSRTIYPIDNSNNERHYDQHDCIGNQFVEW